MCDYLQTTNQQGYSPPAEARRSEEIITALMHDDLGITIDPQAFRLWLRWRWDRVNPLAHRIHEGKR